MPPDAERRLWVTLTELFFLDTEPSEADFAEAARLVMETGWGPARTRDFLVQCVAPVAGGNLGFLVWPVIGAWAGFDEDDLCLKVGRQQNLRRTRPRWWYYLSDKYCSWMLKRLGLERLMRHLA
jgi:hypothetical protein